jgi:multidrug efflux pump
VSTINVEFDLSRDIDFAAQDVRDRVARVRGELPDDVLEPIIAKQEADAQPMIWIALFSDKHTALELADIAENLLKDRLATVKGVSSVVLGGAKRFAIRIRLDSERMAARQITVMDVEDALARQNVDLPSGRLENVDQEMTIQTHGEFKTPEEFNQMVVRKEGNALVRLGDVGRAEIGAEDERSVARYNSKEALGLGVVRQSKANAISVAKGVRAELARLAPELPPGLETYVAYDESIYVEHAIKEVWLTLLIAFLLVVATIFLFLGDPRSTLVPTLAIPVSIIGTFFVLKFMGYTVNILTMLALVLAIGMVVDDAIVVLENIYRHVEEGLSPMQAAFKSMKEIMFAVIVMTVALVAVFLPLVFQTSVAGRLFVEFAVALCGSIVISLFVALSLTPMVSARVLKRVKPTGRLEAFNRRREQALDWLGRKYARGLSWCLAHQRKVVAAALGVLLMGALFYKLLPSDFLPVEDKGRLFSFLLAPEGSTSEYTDRMVRRMEQIVASYPETAGYFSAVALSFGAPGLATQGLMFVVFKDDRDRSLHDLMNGPMGLGARFFGEVEGAFAIPILPKAVESWGQPFQLVLMNPDLKKLNAAAQELAGALMQTGALANVRSAFTYNKPQLSLSIDRERAAALGVSIQDIARTLQVLFGGQDLSTVKRGGKQYDVIVQLDREARRTPDDLNRLFVRGEGGRLIQLNSVVSFKEEAAPNAIYRFNRQRSANIEATPMGVPMGVAMEKTREVLEQKLPEGFRTAWDGEAANLEETGLEGLFLLVLALLVIYIVLAAQFESLVHPFTVMIALPLGFVGGLGLLWALGLVDMLGNMFYGWANYAPDAPWFAHALSFVIPRIPAMNINLFSMIGFLLLLGMVTKNSILLVEFANQSMEAGKSARDAIVEAGRLRLRPILMTAFSTVAGILPIAIGFGAGAEGRRPMGVVVVGGMVLSTFLTLFIVPVVYVLLDKLNARRHPEAPRAKGRQEALT